MLSVLLAAVLSLGMTAGVASARPAALALTDTGPVLGTVAADHRSFQGIPYAAPPVGELRWGSPRPAARWTGIRDARRPGPECAQNRGILGEQARVAEDCLYLNVITPKARGGRPLPVLVWLHGGGFRNGAGSKYDPAALAARGDVVVVTLNYRLGVFGFLAHPALGAGNLGIEDQQAALHWVRRNAAAFGGNPGNVTVFGESAGGVSACAHLFSPRSAGLFHRAIVQSGPCAMTSWPTSGTWLPRPKARAEADATAFATRLGCTEPATAAVCLHAKPAAELLAKAGHELGPVTGDHILPLDPVTALATGRFNRVPVLHGTTRDEHATFLARELLGLPPVSAASYPAELTAIFGRPDAARIAAEYPLTGYRSPSEAMTAVLTDAYWARAAAATHRALARHVPTYAYEFADTEAPWVSTVAPLSYRTGAFHAAELNYLFAAEYFTGTRLRPDQRELGNTMIDYWTRFARTGDPNGPGRPRWAPSSPATDLVQTLAPGHGGIAPVDLAAGHRAEFWRGLGR
ncbi:MULTISPECIES: carboxylesterase/lipase family protein [unclassified Crossiella]|uniref:carboxylesterase/lipase family protein n=1 Tax=unclassified Crossiella TaxID=2620835 RepID=UPI001FFFAECC|nr:MULTISPECIES: carboxylesterase family protein [unclassified Crossiella]MCK2237458.1 carboxylesterase family protein [Crossiella sp. S99.2]MCK2251113.1 carboxylesterase family protein [Crossiella sp. S99.1]